MANFRPPCLWVLLFLCVAVPGQEATETRKEVWPEVAVYFPLRERFRLVVVAGAEKGSFLTVKGLEYRIYRGHIHDPPYVNRVLRRLIFGTL